MILIIIILGLSTYIVLDKFIFQPTNENNNTEEVVEEPPQETTEEEEEPEEIETPDQNDIKFYSSEDGTYTLALISHEVKVPLSAKIDPQHNFYEFVHKDIYSQFTIYGSFTISNNQLVLYASEEDTNLTNNMLYGTGLTVTEAPYSGGYISLTLDCTEDTIILGSVLLRNENSF